MYGEEWREIENAVFVDWPEYEGEESLEAVALRLIELYEIRAEDVIVGTSLGGMVGCEIARLLKMERIFLIGSARHPDEVRALLKYLSGLSKISPIELVQVFCGKYNVLLLEMFKDSNPQFIRVMSRAIFKWEGLDPTACEVVRLHGRKDKVIPIPEETHLVLDGGHLIVMTHGKESVDYLHGYDGF